MLACKRIDSCQIPHAPRETQLFYHCITKEKTMQRRSALLTGGYRPHILLCGSQQPYTIDLGVPNPMWAATYPRALAGTPARNHLNGVLLPTGDVSICGGVKDGTHDNTGVLEAELYHPSTNEWETLEPATVVHNYHSAALLMPDG